MKKSSDSLFDEFPPVTTDEWLEQVKKDIKGKSLESLNWALEEDIVLKPFYQKEDLSSLPGAEHFELKGEWLIAEDFEVQEAVTGPKRCNAAIKAALKFGLEAPVIQIDHAIKKKEFSALLKGIHLEMINIGFSGLFPESDPVGFLKLLTAETSKANMRASAFQGNLQLDPIGFFIENETFYENREADIQSLENSIRYTDKKLPAYRLIQVDMHLMHNQGAQISQELAIALATGSEYLALLTEQGLHADQIHPKMAFSLSVGNQYFPQIAKIRSLKKLWLKVLEGYGSQNPTLPFVRAVTSKRTQVEDQYMNMIQGTTAAMSAILGGADCLTVTPSDHPHGEPSDFSRRIARNVQHILREESHFGKVHDPVAGSYFVEALTAKLMEKAWAKFQKIEAAGGMLAYMM